MSQRAQGLPLLVMGDETERVSDRDAQEYNIQAARAVADAVRSTLGPKGMDKMLVDDIGQVTVTNDGVTILDEMEIENPTAQMIVEVAETQEDEGGDGTTTAITVAGELLAKAEGLLEQDVHPTSIIRGYNEASGRAAEAIREVAEKIDSDDEELLRKVATTSMTGMGADQNKELLAGLVVDTVTAVTVESDSGEKVVDLEYGNIEIQEGRPVRESEVISGSVVKKDPGHEDMPTTFDEASILLIDTAIEYDGTDVDTQITIDDRNQLQRFLDSEDDQLREYADQIVGSGADVVICQNGIDEVVDHFLMKQGILTIDRISKTDMGFLKNLLEAPILSSLDGVTGEDLGTGSIRRSDDDELFYIEGTGPEAHGVTMLLRAPTEHVLDELERGVQDAVDVVTQTVTDGRVLAGGGAIEVEIARRIRDYADSVQGREQLAVEAFADALEVVPRALADNAGLDPIDMLVKLRAAHDDGDTRAGLDVFTGEVVDTFDAGVVEPVHAKSHAIVSAIEAASLVLKIDDIIQAGGEPDEWQPGDEAPVNPRDPGGNPGPLPDAGDPF